ncbi:hypothetical protein BO82DRAFT_356724 [Aspergillus uvarum CBS 121591]|uniref:Uncharacterized protein n=1 Tax=Aspergillus uvarum CBS 121591 TaxID=1448315 RepID=A0A319CKD7_9EURO|nr:hypothetical protein BO82DRAFT_356724 [Aspergillus uvarum CBS 121591]PYH79133.1 hypothetical protein BO82DRAFT_356724 [Aspergillus uvarum CBS 121591]
MSVRKSSVGCVSCTSLRQHGRWAAKLLPCWTLTFRTSALAFDFDVIGALLGLRLTASFPCPTTSALDIISFWLIPTRRIAS